jgi:hypothetical protein
MLCCVHLALRKLNAFLPVLFLLSLSYWWGSATVKIHMFKRNVSVWYYWSLSDLGLSDSSVLQPFSWGKLSSGKLPFWLFFYYFLSTFFIWSWIRELHKRVIFQVSLKNLCNASMHLSSRPAMSCAICIVRLILLLYQAHTGLYQQ